MHTRTIWQTNGLTHWATVTRDECNNAEIRTDCGLVSTGCWESDVHELAEITCPRCRLIGGCNPTEPQTEMAAEEKEKSNPVPEGSNNSPLPASVEGADLIHVYTREQAIADGVLIDVTVPAREAGFRFPVAVTSSVWQQFVRPPAGMEAQDKAGRLWDILWMLRYAIRRGKDRGDIIHFTVQVQNDPGGPHSVPLKAVCGPGDLGMPCLTIMLPGED